jgi:predicted ABC-type ATPase
MSLRLTKTSSGRRSPDTTVSEHSRSRSKKRSYSDAAGTAAGTAAATGSLHSRAADDDDDQMTPTTPQLDDMIHKLETEQREGEGGRVKPWFETDFLLEVLQRRLNPEGRSRSNPHPIFYVLIGPASSGKSSVRTNIHEFRDTMDYAINLDVDEIKLYGNDTLGDTVNKKGNPTKVIEGIQFKYNEVLAKLREPVFEAAMEHGAGHYKNIILDSTGSMKALIKKYMTQAKRNGYTVKVIIVHSSEELCMERVRSRNERLKSTRHETRVIPSPVIKGIYKTFVDKRIARYYATHPAIVTKTDELYCIDNNGERPVILAHRTADGRIDVSRESGLLNRPGAFYGLTIADEAGTPSISGGKSRRHHQYTKRMNKKTMRRRRHRTQRY